MNKTLSPYNYELTLDADTTPAFKIDPDITLPVALPTTGDGYNIVLTEKYKVKGGLLANRDFDTRYEGSLNITVDKNTVIYLTLVFNHTILDADGNDLYTFKSRRTDNVACIVNTECIIHLNDYDSITQIPLGTFTTRDGTEITVDEAVLARNLKLAIEVDLRAHRSSTNLTAVGLSDTAKVHFRQLKDAPAPLSTDGIYPNVDDFKLYFGVDTEEFDNALSIFLAHAIDWAEQYTRRNYSGLNRLEEDEEHYPENLRFNNGVYSLRTYWHRPVSVQSVKIIDINGNETDATNLRAHRIQNLVFFMVDMPSQPDVIKVSYTHLAGASGVVNQVILVYASGLAIQSRIPELQKSTVINERIGDYDVSYGSNLFQLNRTSGGLNLLEKILDNYRNIEL